MSIKKRKRFVAYFYFTGWLSIQFGFHIDFSCPNIEIHVPFGFFKIGQDIFRQYTREELIEKNPIGYEGEWKEII